MLMIHHCIISYATDSVGGFICEEENKSAPKEECKEYENYSFFEFAMEKSNLTGNSSALLASYKEPQVLEIISEIKTPPPEYKLHI